MIRINRRDYALASVALLLLWWLLAAALNAAVLPNPIVVAKALLAELLGGEILLHFLYSLFRVVSGIFLAISLAVPLGLVTGQFASANRFISPILYILNPIPKVVFIPIIFLFTGIGELSKILIIFIILFFQILLLVRDQATEIRRELLLSVRSLGAGRRALMWFVYLPACLPPVFTALRQSIGTAVAVLYLSELFATQYGLGYYIYLQGSTLMNYPAMYAGIIAMSLLGIGLTIFVNRLEEAFCPWKQAI